MKKLLIAAGIVLLLFTLLYYWRIPPIAKAEINGHSFTIETAVNKEERERGLGYRKNMPADHGMVFNFGVPGKYDFWMRGMQFLLDFLWIRDKTIVDITENVPAPEGSQPPVQLTANIPIDKVLELNAG